MQCMALSASSPDDMAADCTPGLHRGKHLRYRAWFAERRTVFVSNLFTNHRHTCLISNLGPRLSPSSTLDSAMYRAWKRRSDSQLRQRGREQWPGHSCSQPLASVRRLLAEGRFDGSTQVTRETQVAISSEYSRPLVPLSSLTSTPTQYTSPDGS